MLRLALSPPGFVTVTVTLPAEPAGLAATMLVLLFTVTLVAAVVPNITLAPARKFVPVIVTPVPPVVGPLLGLILVIVGGKDALYVKALDKLPLSPLGLITATLTAPAVFAGAVAVMELLLVTETLVAAALPKVTVAPETKFVPVIVTMVPPIVEPTVGETLLTVGGTA